MIKPTVGRIVHFGEVVQRILVPRAAIITEVHPPYVDQRGELIEGMVELTVIAPRTVRHVYAVKHSESLQDGTWCYPPRVEDKPAAQQRATKNTPEITPDVTKFKN